ncbi:MAG: hypothetical protein Q8M98_10445 [Candidatus Cloacimonadaceae bacterium]|nr:hypothetical protein [Candidatus Cloacimonadaceae bacterium]
MLKKGDQMDYFIIEVGGIRYDISGYCWLDDSDSDTVVEHDMWVHQNGRPVNPIIPVFKMDDLALMNLQVASNSVKISMLQDLVDKAFGTTNTQFIVIQ